MKILNFLTNKAGKLVIGGTQIAVLTVGAAGLFSSAAFKVGENIGEKELAVRPLSAVSASTGYEGLNRRTDGMLSSMNIQNREGRKGVAIGADRERLEGSLSNNDFGLTAVDNLGRTVSVPGAGAAATTSATDGLGSGGVDMVEVGGGSSSVRVSMPGVSSSSVAQGATGGQVAAGDSSGARLASASMARASGNAFNAASGSMGGGSVGASGGGRGGASGSRASGSDGYQFSGSMPSGSNVVSAHSGLSGVQTGPSHFVAGGRNASVGRGGRRVNETDDLKKISKMSADVAKDRNRGVVAGAKPFLANSATTAGMSIESGADTTTTGSADFSAPESRNLKAIGDWGQQVDNTAKERSADRRRLTWLLIGSIIATAAAIPSAYALITAGKAASPVGWVKVALGIAILAAAAALSTTMLVYAGKYAHKWSGGFLSTISAIIGGVSIVSLGLTAAYAFAGSKMPFGDWVAKIMPKLGKAGISAGKGLVKSTAMGMVGQEVTKNLKS